MIENLKMCDKITGEFHHPLYGILNLSQTRKLKGELTRHLIDEISMSSLTRSCNTTT